LEILARRGIVRRGDGTEDSLNGRSNEIDLLLAERVMGKGAGWCCVPTLNRQGSSLGKADNFAGTDKVPGPYLSALPSTSRIRQAALLPSSASASASRASSPSCAE
jgi:hypothetical protein